MATITKPMALDESFNTTEVTSRNQADVLAGIENAIREGFGQVASGIEYDNTESSITATNVQDAIDEVDGIVDGIESDIQGTQSVSGNLITVTDAAPIYAEEVDVAVECTQTGSGAPSPSNIRPIQGYDIVSVDRCGKNLIGNGTQLNGFVNSGDMTFNTNSNSIGYYFKTSELPDTITMNATNGNRAYYGYFDDVPASGVICKSLNQSQQTLPNTISVNRTYKYIHLQFSYNQSVTNVQVEKGNQATTYEPYNGQTVSLQLGNKNLLPMTVDKLKEINTSGSWSGNVYTLNDATFTVNTDKDGLITDIKINTSSAVTTNVSFYIGTGLSYSAGNYILSTGDALPSGLMFAIQTEGGNVTVSNANSANVTNKITNSLCWIYIPNTVSVSNYTIKPMLRSASVTDPTFSPYNPTLGGMVYGGQLTLNDDGSAVFVGDKVYKEFTANDSNTWNLLSGYSNTFYCAWTKDSIAPTATGTDGICSSYNVVRKAIANLVNGEITLNHTSISSAYSSACVKDTQYSTAANFKASLTTPLQIVYPLATPFTIHLSAEQLKLLQGTNNVWSNAGDVTLKYQPDNVIAEPKADVQRLRDDVDLRLIDNACKNLVQETLTDYTIESSGRITGSTGFNIHIAKIKAGTTYTVTSNDGFVAGYFYNKPAGGSYSYNGSRVVSSNCTFVAPIDGYIAFRSSGGYLTPQCEYGLEQTAYEEYYPSNRELWEMIKALQ